MTHDFSVKDYYYFKKSAESLFIQSYKENEYRKIVELCKRTFNRDFSNEVCVRLDGYNKEEQKIGLKISKIHFYDFLVSNFLILNFDKLLSNASSEERIIINTYRNAIISCGDLTSFDSIIANRFLSNIIAISLIIEDDYNLLITKRNGKVGISNDFISTTVTGTVDESDFYSNDPLKNCCVRECKEELDYILDPEQIKLNKIVCGYQKTQPIALLNVKVDSVFDIEDSIRLYKGFHEENSNYFIIAKKEIPGILLRKDIMLTEAGRSHFEGLLS